MSALICSGLHSSRSNEKRHPEYFDLWAARWRRREATGDMIIVRYADDIVVGFEREIDARSFWDAMGKRLQEFSLTLHPDKTRLLEFGRHAATNRQRRGVLGALSSERP